ncbi:hypothetical protein [Rhabdothermincola sp.]|uniref:PIN-like domain-containing protein n=1 Tax=Rhabdothermincola sp. TaxID=2820405 RepID=UPI002FE18C22
MPAGFFVDENDLALGRELDAMHGCVLYPGHPNLPEVPRGALDDDWLAVVGARRLVVITRDRRIRYRPVERAAWVAHGVRGFVLTGRKSQTTDESVAVLTRHWAQIAELVTAEPDGPWMRSVTEHGIRCIALTASSGDEL